MIVDLTARAYDGVAAIRTVRAAGRPVLAVGQHDDADLRRRALAAGADRVHPYRQLFEDGPRQLGRWLNSGPERTVPDPTTPEPTSPDPTEPVPRNPDLAEPTT